MGRYPILLFTLAVAWTSAAAPARATSPPGDVGPYLRAGSELRLALCGRRGLTHEDLPGSQAGLEVRPDHERPFDRAKLRRRLFDDGRAYAAGDSLMITTVLVSRREIAVLFGHGGYDPSQIRADTDPSEWRRQVIEMELRALKDGPIATSTPGVYYYWDQLSDDAREFRRRQLESERGQAIKAQDDAAANNLQMARQRVARVAGSRIRIRFDHDIPLADLNARSVRELLAPYLSLSD